MRSSSSRASKVTLLIAAGVLLFGLAACGEDSEENGGNDAGGDKESGQAAEAVTITATEYKFDLPATLPAGKTTFTLVNEGKEQHFIEIIELKADAPPVAKLIKSKKPPDQFFVRQAGGTKPVKPGETSKPFEVDLTPGRYGYVCFIESPKGKPHAFLGMFGEFTV